MIRIGTSGWVYPPWRGTFYPRGLAQRRELEHLSRRVNAIEINGSFYSLQRPTSYQAWAAQTPEGFAFAVKGGRFITHMKKLRDVETPLANFFASGVLALGPKLGPVLWQLPPVLAFDPQRLDAFLAQLPRSTNGAARLAEQHDKRLDGRAWTVTDADRPLHAAGTPPRRTAPGGYRACAAGAVAAPPWPRPRAGGPVALPAIVPGHGQLLRPVGIKACMRCGGERAADPNQSLVAPAVVTHGEAR